MTCNTQFGHCQDVGQGIIVRVDNKVQSIKVFMEFPDHSSLEGEKLQFVGRVMGFGLCQAPTGIGNDSIWTIIMSLIEDSPQTRPASVSMELKRVGEIGIGKDRCHGAQVFKGHQRTADTCHPT